MTKDYFMDLRNTAPKKEPEETEYEEVEDAGEARSIRNITVARRAARPAPPFQERRSAPRRPSGNRAIVLIAGLAILLVLGFFGLMFYGETTVTVTPREHQVTFDPSTPFTAFPNSASSTLSYRIETSTFEDSSVVPAQGMEKAEERASGNIRITNSYSKTPVRLIKNTRFQTPEGLIYRIASSVEVPGMNGTVPGELTILVLADQAGPEYNIPAGVKLTVPGLKGTAAMFEGVRAESVAAFVGGYIGDRPVAKKEDLDATRAQLRARLQEKALSTAKTGVADGFVFPELSRISFESLPTVAAEGGARIQEKAILTMPVFPTAQFTALVGSAVSADSEGASISFEPAQGFTAQLRSDPAVLGTGPLMFSLGGSARLKWTVNTQELAAALAGRGQDSFQSIVASFPGVEKAEASLVPFWSKTFPKDAQDIQVKTTPQ